MRLAATAALVAAFFMGGEARAHDWYSDTSDPRFKNSCCGGTDCAVLEIGRGVLAAEELGYRVRLTLEQAQRLNPYRTKPVDTLVTWDRVQPSPDGKFHMCIRTYDDAFEKQYREQDRAGAAYCFWAPPNT